MTLRGATYDPATDRDRLMSGLDATREVMDDGRWRTKPEITASIQDRYGLLVPEESVGRYLRYLKEEEHGGYDLDKRRRCGGTYEYRCEQIVGDRDLFGQPV